MTSESISSATDTSSSSFLYETNMNSLNNENDTSSTISFETSNSFTGLSSSSSSSSDTIGKISLISKLKNAKQNLFDKKLNENQIEDCFSKFFLKEGFYFFLSDSLIA